MPTNVLRILMGCAIVLLSLGYSMFMAMFAAGCTAPMLPPHCPLAVEILQESFWDWVTNGSLGLSLSMLAAYGLLLGVDATIHHPRTARLLNVLISVVVLIGPLGYLVLDRWLRYRQGYLVIPCGRGTTPPPFRTCWQLVNVWEGTFAAWIWHGPLGLSLVTLLAYYCCSIRPSRARLPTTPATYTPAPNEHR